MISEKYFISKNLPFVNMSMPTKEFTLVICLLKIEESAFWMSDITQKKYFNVLYAMASVK